MGGRVLILFAQRIDAGSLANLLDRGSIGRQAQKAGDACRLGVEVRLQGLEAGRRYLRVRSGPGGAIAHQSGQECTPLLPVVLREGAAEVVLAQVVVVGRYKIGRESWRERVCQYG